ncbi:hypothetical protein [Burkholderia orbicola]|uniref:hypothetical protein n=1 Tax=Burkholderia orbicola TaxID=2978683 RepID=UPI002656F3A9|nr:hypothetical protein [Burkholderia orbicola]MDN7533839.1 hypothetical protein [Burkholderia orbicola]
MTIRRTTFAVVSIGILALAGCAPPPLKTSELTEDHFRRTATVTDGDLETAATISTLYGWQPDSNLLVGRVSDTYLRAFIDKKSGATLFQVYTWLRYPGDWRDYRQSNYLTVDGLKTAAVTNLGQANVDCSLRAVGCIYLDQLGFTVTESDLRRLRAVHGATPSFVWRFKLKARNGPDCDGELSVAEIGGLLARVDQYRHEKNMPAWSSR